MAALQGQSGAEISTTFIILVPCPQVQRGELWEGMTGQEYDEWLRLYKDVQDAGKNREIDDAHKSTFEQACALLLEFEEQHPAVSSVIPFEFRKEEP